MSKTKLPVPLPVQQYARCVNARNRPADYIGDWPARGQVYPVQMLRHAGSDDYQVQVLGFYAEQPRAAFEQHRFELIAQVWLN